MIVNKLFNPLLKDNYLNHVFKIAVFISININNSHIIFNLEIDEKYLCSPLSFNNIRADVTEPFQRCMRYEMMMKNLLKSYEKINQFSNEKINQFSNELNELNELNTNQNDYNVLIEFLNTIQLDVNKKENMDSKKDIKNNSLTNNNLTVNKVLDKFIKTLEINYIKKYNKVESFKLYFDETVEFKYLMLNLLNKKPDNKKPDNKKLNNTKLDDYKLNNSQLDNSQLDNNQKTNLLMWKDNLIKLINKNFDNYEQSKFINIIDRQIILDSYVGIVYFSYLNLTKQMSGGHLRFLKRFGTKPKANTQVNAVNRVNPIKQPSINDLSNLNLYNFAYMSFSLKNKIKNPDGVEQFLNTHFNEIVNVMNNKNGNKPVITFNNLHKNHLKNSTAGGSRRTKTKSKVKAKKMAKKIIKQNIKK